VISKIVRFFVPDHFDLPAIILAWETWLVTRNTPKEFFMEKQIADGEIGSIGHYNVEFKDKKLVLAASADFKIGNMESKITVDSNMIVEAIKKAIPGQIDDAILNLLETLL
jgi:hypothetical protein